MHTISSKEGVIAWLKKNGWPDITGAKYFIWAISPAVGAIAEDSYVEWDGSFESLPKDRRIVLKKKGLKAYCRIHLDSSPGESERRSENPEPIDVAIIPPEIAREKQELFELRTSLERRESNIRSMEAQLRDWEVDIKRSQAMTIKIASELDLRTQNNMARMKEYEEHLDRRKLGDENYLSNLNEAYGEISELKESHMLFNKVSFTIDKIASSFALRGALSGLKGLSDDDLKKLPADFANELGKFFADRSEREYFRTVPEPYKIVGEGFQRLPDNENKAEFARIIIYWCIENCPNLINEIAREEKEKKQSMQQSS